MKPRISVLVPTRQRPERLRAYYESAMQLADKPKRVEFVAYIDEDDHSYDGLELPRLFKVLGPRIVLSEAWNECWRYAEGEIYHHGGDDNLFRTKGWDSIVIDAFNKYPDRILFAYGDDGNEQSRLNKFGTHGFVHKNWTDITGRFVPPYFVSDYNDTWFNDVAKALGRHEHIPILIEHMHYSLGKSEIDQNTKDRLARHETEKPQEIYFSPKMVAERELEAEGLREWIDKPIKWSVLIATVGERAERFAKLVNKLNSQVEPYRGSVEILAYWNNFEQPIAEIRQALLEEARGDYVSFIDDDDDIPEYYVDEIMKALESNPDYVGWVMQFFENGQKMKPTYHSIRYTDWSDDDKGYYRNLSHLNPIRRTVALEAGFVHKPGVAEDQDWVGRAYPLVKNEVYIGKVMYFYQHNQFDSVWKGKYPPIVGYDRPDIRHKYFRYHPDCKVEYRRK